MRIKLTNISISSADNKGQLRTRSLTNNNSSKNNTEALCWHGRRVYAQSDSVTWYSTGGEVWQLWLPCSFMQLVCLFTMAKNSACVVARTCGVRLTRRGHVVAVTPVRLAARSTFLEVHLGHAAVHRTNVASTTASPNVVHATRHCNSSRHLLLSRTLHFFRAHFMHITRNTVKLHVAFDNK